MVQISNKPNINGIKNASEDADYSSMQGKENFSQGY